MDSTLESKVALVWDFGNNVELARRLAREFGQVMYWKDWKRSAPVIHERIVGDGYDEITRVQNIADALPKIDIAIFPDIHLADWQTYLEGQGIRVWGSRTADKYEYNRLLFKKALKEVGLPVVPFKVCNGMSSLRDYLSENQDKWIKQNSRGDGETWKHHNYRLSQPKLDAMDYYYGPVKEEIQFIVDDEIDTVVEAAYDGYMITDPNGKPLFPKQGFLGYEDKNQAHILAVTDYDEMSEAIRDVNDRFAPKLAAEKCRSQWGTEIKVTEDFEYFFLDPTPRVPCPPGEIVLELVGNLGEIMWHGSVGEMVEMETVAPFGSQVMLYSTWANTNHQPVLIPKKIRPFVKLFNCYHHNGVDWVIPNQVNEPLGGGREQIGSVCALGDSIEEANESVIEMCGQIEGFETTPQIESLAECLRRIKEGEEQGVEFTDEPIPEPSTVLES